jgi:colicin import membrane protein
MIAESAIGETAQLDGSSWGLMLAVSVILHLAVLSAAIFLSGVFQTREDEDVVYEVDLVSMPALSPQAQAAASSKSESVIQESTPAKKAVPIEEKKIPIPSEKTPVKKPVAKKEEATQNNVEVAIARLQKKVKAEGGEHLDQAISDLEKKNKSEEGHLGNALARLQSKTGEPGTKSGIPSNSRVQDVALQIYKGQITAQIYSNWSYPTAISNKKGLEAIVILKVSEDGKIIESPAFKKKSNNPIFDQSVLKAIEKSNPLLPLPEGRGSYEEIEVKFNLEKLLEN